MKVYIKEKGRGSAFYSERDERHLIYTRGKRVISKTFTGKKLGIGKKVNQLVMKKRGEFYSGRRQWEGGQHGVSKKRGPRKHLGGSSLGRLSFSEVVWIKPEEKGQNQGGKPTYS